MTCRIGGGNPGVGRDCDENRVACARLSRGIARAAAARRSAQTASGVAILQVDTDRRLGTIDPNIYGQFLEHINHSVEDGLFAEQIRGAGFEGTRLRDVLDSLWTAGRRARRRDSVRAWHEERADHRRRASRQESGSGECSWSPAGAMTDRSGSRSSRARRGCHCACWRRMEACSRIVHSGARIGVAGSAVLVHERAHRSRRDDRDRRRRTRRRARRLRVADARRRAQERHAASRSPRLPSRTRAHVHPLAGRLVRLDLQMAGRHRPVRVARLPPERNVGRLLRLLRLRHRRIPGAHASARRRSADRTAGAGRQSGLGRVRDELGALRQRSGDDHVGADARAQRTSRAVPRPLLPDRQRADEQRLHARALRRHRQSLRQAACGRSRRMP